MNTLWGVALPFVRVDPVLQSYLIDGLFFRLSDIPWKSLSSYLVSPLLSIFVALFTVGTTLYLQEKRERVHSLLALKTEVESNREITADALLSLSLDVLNEDPGSLTPSSLSADSYVVARNNGTIAKVSGNTRKLISDHYTKVSAANSEIAKVRELWLEFRTTSESDRDRVQKTLLTTEQRTLEMLLMLFDDVENNRIRDVKEYVRHMNENVIGSFEYSYKNIDEEIDEEIDDINFSFIFR